MIRPWQEIPVKIKNTGVALSITLLILLLVSGCSDGHSDPFDGPVRTFWTYNFRNSSSVMITARLMATGDHCLVYVQGGKEDQIGTDRALDLALEFDNDIYGLVRGSFGEEPDMDGNGKVIILVLDIQDWYGTPDSDGSYYAGYFHSADLYTGITSNRADMFYMDCFPGTVGDRTFYNTLAHEFQHMINYNQKVFIQGGLPNETWIDEGLSSAAEQLYGGTITEKVDYWNYDPRDYIALGTSFLSWSGFLENYASVYLFFRWVEAQASNGSGIYKEIIDNGTSDYRAVLEPVQTRIGNLNDADWADTLLSWYLTNLLQESGTLFSYGQLPDLTLTPSWFNSTDWYEPGEPWNLYAGEGIYLYLGDLPQTVSITGGGSGIHYAGVNTQTGAIDRDGSDGYTGDVLVACNGSAVPAASATDYEQTAPLPAVSAVAISRTKSRTMPDKMPVDALPGRETRY
jgi:hypothetical protein